jgi:hypothetical protein
VPEQLLTILKFCLLALIYLFFFRVLRAVWAEISPSKVPTSARGRSPAPSPSPMAAPVAPVGTYAGAPTGAPTMPPTGSVPSAGVRRAGGRQPDGAAQLVVIEPPALQGRTYSLGDELTIGRAAQCQVTLDDNFVSQTHARVYPRDGNYVVEDLGSTNGTYLNRTKLSGAMMMQRGDRLQVGNTVLELV